MGVAGDLYLNAAGANSHHHQSMQNLQNKIEAKYTGKKLDQLGQKVKDFGLTLAQGAINVGERILAVPVTTGRKVYYSPGSVYRNMKQGRLKDAAKTVAHVVLSPISSTVYSAKDLAFQAGNKVRRAIKSATSTPESIAKGELSKIAEYRKSGSYESEPKLKSLFLHDRTYDLKTNKVRSVKDVSQLDPALKDYYDRQNALNTAKNQNVDWANRLSEDSVKNLKETQEKAALDAAQEAKRKGFSYSDTKNYVKAAIEKANESVLENIKGSDKGMLVKQDRAYLLQYFPK